MLPGRFFGIIFISTLLLGGLWQMFYSTSVIRKQPFQYDGACGVCSFPFGSGSIQTFSWHVKKCFFLTSFFCWYCQCDWLSGVLGKLIVWVWALVHHGAEVSPLALIKLSPSGQTFKCGITVNIHLTYIIVMNHNFQFKPFVLGDDNLEDGCKKFST